MRAADLGDPRPPGPAPLDGVIQRPSARAERGVDDHEQEEHERVDDPRPDVRRTGTVRTAEPLGHGPDDEAQENPTRVCDLSHEAEEEGERDGQLEEADRRREETGVRAHGLAPEAEPRLKPAGLARAGVGDHLGELLAKIRIGREIRIVGIAPSRAPPSPPAAEATSWRVSRNAVLSP